MSSEWYPSVPPPWSVPFIDGQSTRMFGQNFKASIKVKLEKNMNVRQPQNEV